MRLRVITLGLLLSLCAVVSQSLAQTRSEKLDNTVFYSQIFVSDFFGDSTKWAWEFDVVYRRQGVQNSPDFWANPLRYAVRLWISYQLTKMTRISVNPLALLTTAPRQMLESDAERPFERELRSTFQLNYQAFFDRFNFTHRFRLESRWRGIDNPGGAAHSMRFRYRLRMRTPINTDYFYTNNTIYISNYHEICAEWGVGFGTNYLQQVRNFVGVGYRFWDWTRVELGYLHVMHPRGNNRQIDVSQGIMFYLYFDLLSRNEVNYLYSF